MRRIALVGASLALIGGMTAACGGAPDDASKDDFCKGYEKVAGSNDIDEAKDAADALSEIGTPEDIDGDAREGFEKELDLVDDADDLDDYTEALDDLDSGDKDKIEAFHEESRKLCE